MSDNILVISPTPSHPQTAGNRARIFSLLSYIVSLGYNVHFLHINQENGDKHAMQACWGNQFYTFPYRQPRNWLQQQKRRFCKHLKLSCAYTYRIDEWYDSGLDEFLTELSNKHSFKAVMVEYVFMSRVLECFSADTLKVIDTHDVFTNRHRHFLAQGECPTWYSTTAREEAKGLNRADAIIAIQQNEADFFASITPRKIITVGHILEPRRHLTDNIVAGRILLIGSNNKINVLGANYFLEEIFPQIKSQLPHAELALAGSICEEIGNHKDVVRLGVLDDLSTAYESAAVVVNPVLFGTGLKIKSLEAMSYSKPLVTTSAGAEGIEEGNREAFKLAGNDKMFAEFVVQILEQPQVAEKLSMCAYEFVAARNQQACDALKQLFGSNVKTIQEEARIKFEMQK